MSPKIFISYRREDCQATADHLYEKLEDHFGSGNVFFDVDSIPLGRDFVEYLDEQVSQCDVLLALVGKGWLGEKDEDGACRLQDENDFVRIEVISALNRDITVIPVLVEGAGMPAKEMLPPELESFSRRQAAQVRSGRDFRRDVDDLIKALEAMGVEDTAGVCEATGVSPEVGSSLPAPPEIKVFEGDDIAIEDPIVEKAIREQLKKPTGELTNDLEQVTELTLFGTKITDEGLKEVAKIKQLAVLNLGYTQITNTGLKEVAKLENLTYLELDGTHITDTGLKEVAKLQQLTSLDLCRANITDAGLKEVAKLKQLEVLWLTDTYITDAGLKEVAKIKQLAALNLGYTKITDAGLKEVAKMKQLDSLSIERCPNITDASVAELQKALPKCKIWSN